MIGRCNRLFSENNVWRRGNWVMWCGGRGCDGGAATSGSLLTDFICNDNVLPGLLKLRAGQSEWRRSQAGRPRNVAMRRRGGAEARRPPQALDATSQRCRPHPAGSLPPRPRAMVAATRRCGAGGGVVMGGEVQWRLGQNDGRSQHEYRLCMFLTIQLVIGNQTSSNRDKSRKLVI